MEHQHINKLHVKDLGIDTYRENIIYMRADCPVCRLEGFTALTRMQVSYNGRTIIATLNVVVAGDQLQLDEAGLSTEAIKRLGAKEGDEIIVSHLKPVASLSSVRKKMYGRELDEKAFLDIVTDIVAGRYSNIELAAFITACAGDHLSVSEIIGLTSAMVGTGQKLLWDSPVIMDKHSVGGLPGNRTTPIVVSIAAAAGLTIPKTSSRAITSPAGTADTMETMTRVNLTISEMQDIVRKHGGCLAWGGSVKLSPSDDVLISVERALDVDSEGQMIASVLSKKVAAGATHVLIDIPVGETAKVRTTEQALKLQYYFKAVSEAIGLTTEVTITDGSQPIGRGIGPSLEAMDVLDVLRNRSTAPADLKAKAIELSGRLLELSGKYDAGRGREEALHLLESGKALEKFMTICEAQGGFIEPQFARYTYDVKATKAGVVTSVDNRKLARVAKLAGAPKTPAAGIRYFAPLGRKVNEGDVLFTIYADAEGELRYATEYLESNNHVVVIE